MFIYLVLLIVSAWVVYGSGRHMAKWLKTVDNDRMAFGILMGNGSFYVFMFITLVMLAMTPWWYLMPVIAGATLLQVVITKRALAQHQVMMRDQQRDGSNRRF